MEDFEGCLVDLEGLGDGAHGPLLHRRDVAVDGGHHDGHLDETLPLVGIDHLGGEGDGVGLGE